MQPNRPIPPRHFERPVYRQRPVQESNPPTAGQGRPTFAAPRPPGPGPAQPPQPPPPPAAPPKPRPWWRRGNVPFAMALVVLLPVALGVPWWLDYRTNVAEGSTPAVAQPVSGHEGEINGLYYDFRGVLYNETGGSPKKVPKGTVFVDALFKVTAEDEKAAKRLLTSCDFRAVDDTGRTWERTSLFGTRELPKGVVAVAFGCAGTDLEPIEPGKSQAYVASFLVPKDAKGSLRIEAKANSSGDPDKPRPQVLAFTPK